MADINGRPDNIQDYLASLHTGQWFGFNNKEPIYKNLVVLDSSKTKPTEQECTDGLAKLQTDFDNNKTEQENKKASAKKKLQDLGLTVDEIKEAFGI